MSDTLKDRFANFLSEIEQIELDNEKLNDDIQALEKEKDAGYDKFNTETHILIEKSAVESVTVALDEAYRDCDTASEEADCLGGQAEEVRSSARYAKDEVKRAKQKLEELLEEEEAAE